MVGCTVSGKNDVGAASGTGIAVVNGGSLTVVGGVVQYSTTGVQAGDGTDLSTTIANLSSLTFHNNTTDIDQNGTSTLNFTSGSAASSKITVNDSTNVTLSFSDVDNDNSLFVGKLSNLDVTLLQAGIAAAPNNPELNYFASLYGAKSVAFQNNAAGDATLASISTGATNAKVATITRDRTQIAGARLMSDTAAPVGGTTALRGWDINKAATTADLEFDYQNSDTAGQAAVTPYTVMNLSGINNKLTVGGTYTPNGTPTTTGSLLDVTGQTFNDNATAASGTAPAAVFTSFETPTLTATNTGVTTTDAATVYIAGAPIAGTNETITNPYALWIASGNTLHAGDILFDNTATRAISMLDDTSAGATNSNSLNIQGTNRYAGSGAAGNVQIRAGESALAGTGNGGDIFVVSGGSATGSAGKIQFTASMGAVNGYMNYFTGNSSITNPVGAASINILANSTLPTAAANSINLIASGGVNINTAGTASTNIGNTTGTVTITNASITSAGTTSLTGNPLNLNVNAGGNVTNINTGTTTGNTNIGNGNGASAVTVDVGTGGLSLGATATAHTTTLGSTTGTSATTVQSGSGALNVTSTNGALTVNSGTGALGISNDATNTTVSFATGAGVKTVTLGSSNTTSTTNIQSGSGAVNVNASINNPTNINSGTSTGAVTIGNPSASITTHGVTTINTTAADGNTSIGNTSNTLALIGSTANINNNTGGAQTVNINNGTSTGNTNIGNATGTVTITNASITSAGATSLTGNPLNLNVDAGSNVTNINTGTTTGAVHIADGAVDNTISIGSNVAGIKAVSIGGSGSTSGTAIVSGTTGIGITANNGPIAIVSGTGTIGISTDATNTTVNIATGAGVKNTTVGSTNTTSTTVIQSGSGAVQINNTANDVQIAAGGSTTATLFIGRFGAGTGTTTNIAGNFVQITGGNGSGGNSIVLNGNNGTVNIPAPAAAVTTFKVTGNASTAETVIINSGGGANRALFVEQNGSLNNAVGVTANGSGAGVNINATGGTCIGLDVSGNTSQPAVRVIAPGAQSAMLITGDVEPTGLFNLGKTTGLVRWGTLYVVNVDASGQINSVGTFGRTVGGSGIPVVIDNTGLMGTAVSSIRFKENVQDMADASDAILQLRPVTFNYKADAAKTRTYGLIAEEVEQIMPGLVVHDAEQQIHTVKYHELPILLLNELQKQQLEIKNQKALIDQLIARMQTLEGRA